MPPQTRPSPHARRVRTAVATAGTLGLLSLMVALRGWDGRLQWNPALAWSVGDALLMLGLAAALERWPRPAAAALSVLAAAGTLAAWFVGLAPVVLLLRAFATFVFARVLLAHDDRLPPRPLP